MGPPVIWVGSEDPNDLDIDPKEMVINPDPSRGLGSSVSLASEVAQSMKATSLLILLADMPLLREDFVLKLLNGSIPSASVYPNGKIGVPAHFPAKMFGELAKISGDKGAADLLRSLPDLRKVQMSENDAFDVDSQEDIRVAENLIRHSK
jgi:CTP:molybdopterin cytidylyltransferase MocA